ncbi:substrate-binding periplasmic protein [Chitinimonas sp. BJB300]|uniref:substrate-binding periplasmic protein n=1 Tax=Chitinimonas sp. BJB300 TaxID=1559339 RepID=UPI001304065E|nr:transporter substrate-binding domain-containing protein [Chitinimonas sp. BJB300]
MISAEAGLRFEIKPYPWRRAQKLAEHGEGLLWAVVSTPERARHLEFSEPIFPSKVWIVVPVGKAFPYQDIHSLSGKTIAIGGGVYYGEAFATYRDKLFN